MTPPRGTFRWGRRTAERWLAAWAHEPVLVAESLRRLHDPLEPILAGRATATPTEVVSAIATALRPVRAADPPPAWLRPDQEIAFRRTVAVLRQHGGALLAEPVGTGKSWIALAAAATLGATRVAVLAPAALVPQWIATAARTGVAATVHSHEAISRRRLPTGEVDLVIIDESHRFRDPATRRYRAVAPWLVGRRCLLVSATPIVNHPRDLSHQLRLCLRDDLLAAAGLPSLRALDRHDGALEALGEVVIAGCTVAANRPALHRDAERVRQDRRLGQVLRELDRLGLSTDPGVAALVRTSLWGAAASSPSALSAALLRYLALLDHAEDAARAGQRLDREALRRFVAADPAQLVLWELLPRTETTGDLVLADREAVARLRAEAARAAQAADTKVARLRARVADGRRTLVFTTAIATVNYLRSHLGPEPVAWCTGARAGIDATVLPRDAVLAWFAPGAESAAIAGVRAPRLLVTTDVAAEGLDLQLAERVVHYDLPWTAIRADQRTGRVHRLGSAHAGVEEYWLLPPRALARRLGVESAIARKRRLPGALGIGERSAARWRRRQEVSSPLATDLFREGVAQLQEGPPDAEGVDAIAGVRIEGTEGRGVTRLFVHRPGVGWTGDEAAALALLPALVTAVPASRPDPARAAALIDALAAPVRSALRVAAGRQWDPAVPTPVVARLLRRLRHWARIAARARDGVLLDRLDRAVRGLGRGLTAGEEWRLAQLAGREHATLHEHLAQLPQAPPPLAIPTVRLVGMVAWDVRREK